MHVGLGVGMGVMAVLLIGHGFDLQVAGGERPLVILTFEADVRVSSQTGVL